MVRREKSLSHEYSRWKAYGKEVSDEFVSQYSLSDLIDDIEALDPDEEEEE
jgi:hypothetical protein